MTLARAKTIVGSMTLLTMQHMGIETSEQPESLEKLSLSTLLLANKMVQRANAAEDKKPFVDGKRSTTRQLVCDDRLIAAIYCAYHFPAVTDDTIVSIGDKFLCCIPRHVIKFDEE